ncbi:hypothetical protein DKG71_42190 (plasmid) [Streptomyces sp. NEAU-S7GS2]|nr:hypothetical protein DKG71_42190 [Streptomyces sp. NEAU-S7GS2]
MLLGHPEHSRLLTTTPVHHHDEGHDDMSAMQPTTTVRPGIKPTSGSGPTDWWPDGLTTYTLQFRGGHTTWLIADEADTVLKAVDRLHSGEEFGDGYGLPNALRDTRRLMTRLAAVQDELILYAREAGEDGRPRMSWRSISDELSLHFSTVRERHARMVAGEHAEWRNWLVQGTARAAMYGGTADGWHAASVHRVPAHSGTGTEHQARCACGWQGTQMATADAASEQGAAHEESALAPTLTPHHTEVYDLPAVPGRPETKGQVFARCQERGCIWESEPMSNVVVASKLGKAHEADPENRTLRTNLNEWDRGQEAAADLCREDHPRGDTQCSRPAGHDAVPGDLGHVDAISRAWTNE